MQRLTLTSAGPPARSALFRVVAAAKAGDPLAPVTVAAPSGYAGASILREWAGRGGSVNTRIVPLRRLGTTLTGPVLAARGRTPLTAAARAELLRRALARDPRAGGAVDPRDHAAAGFFDESDALRAARDLVTRNLDAFPDLGHLVVFVPRTLDPEHLGLLRALARAARAWAIIGLTGDDVADEPARELAARLADVLGSVTTTVSLDPVRPVTRGAPRARVVSCPDASSEVREAVRIVVREASGGVPLHRIAVAHRGLDPYTRLVPAELRAAGIPVTGPGVRTAAESAAGRTLLALVRLPERAFHRDDVLALLAAAPILEHADGPTAPAGEWERLACDARVVHGVDHWRERLERHGRQLAARLGAHDEGCRRAFLPSRRLARFLTELAGACDPGPIATWKAFAAWANRLLDRYVGTPPSLAGFGWPPYEIAAATEVRRRLYGLAELDAIGHPVDRSAFAAALTEELRTPLAPLGSFGDGVFVGPMAALRGVDLDLVLLVGLVEGTTAHGDEFLHASQSASRRVMLFPRVDPRSRRATRPAPEVVATARAMAGRMLVASDLRPEAAEAGHGVAEGWLAVVDSAHAALAGMQATRVSLAERDLADLLAWRERGLPMLDHPLSSVDPVLERGFRALHARRADRYGPWEGVVGARPELRPSAERPQSATALERWSECPFRYLLERVLHARELERPALAEQLEPQDRGSVIHAVLHEVADDHPAKPSHEPWSAQERQHAQQLAARLLAEAEQGGHPARTLLRQRDRRTLLAEIDRVLDTDEQVRARDDLVPVGTEVVFGESGPLPALHLSFHGQRTSVAGRIDRIDRRADGSAFEVFDYKTGRAVPVDQRDPLAGGTRLQLAVYALAVRAANPDAEVRASYWHTAGATGNATAGFDLDDTLQSRTLDVLRDAVDGIASGVFPPSPLDHRGESSRTCRHCPYQRACPADRVRRWEQRIADPVLAPYLAMRRQEAA